MTVMDKRSKPKPDDPAQYKRFLEAAREAGAADDKKAADQAFKTVTSKPLARRSRPSGKKASS